MKVRSLGLAVCGLALLLAAVILGALLVHDGETEDLHLDAVEQGDVIELKGKPEPFFPPSLALWAPVRPFLDNHTYTLAAEDGFVALLTSAEAMPADVVLAEGTVAYVGPHPSDRDVLLVVVHVQGWREPFLFR